MRATTLVVPGLNSSGAGHWQTWMESRIADAVRVEQTRWDEPVLVRWAGTVVRSIDRATGSVFLIAHSFGCLAAISAVRRRVDRVAGALLVAPADPEHFSATGLRDASKESSIGHLLPDSPFAMPSVVVASSNDRWMKLTTAAFWADRWGSRLISLGAAGHINAESGFGRWPFGLDLYDALRDAQRDLPVGRLDGAANPEIRISNAPFIISKHKQQHLKLPLLIRKRGKVCLPPRSRSVLS